MEDQKTLEKSERDDAGRFKEGHALAGPGRPKGSKNAVNSLTEALESHYKVKGTTFWKRIAEETDKDSRVMLGVLRKIVPDKQQVTVSKEVMRESVQELAQALIEKFPTVEGRAKATKDLREIAREVLREQARHPEDTGPSKEGIIPITLTGTEEDTPDGSETPQGSQ